jgi:hypothetical protein
MQLVEAETGVGPPCLGLCKFEAGGIIRPIFWRKNFNSLGTGKALYPNLLSNSFRGLFLWVLLTCSRIVMSCL